jgi:hypothetical protein
MLSAYSGPASIDTQILCMRVAGYRNIGLKGEISFNPKKSEC